ncbi:RNA polymerase sigma factor [Nocardioides speluncae]|uniref:RNA polymerase sigma factor n=1 Tax=Nocardioides speluncae TaxID=2670337 RepID=UPI001F0C8B18|nr:RNA polymerase sigma factor [Nocardioides speluncae]
MTSLEGIDMAEAAAGGPSRSANASRSPTDSDLVADLRDGSSAALGILFDRYSDRIYNYCFRRTASWDVAEDATSATFLEAWKSRDRTQVYDESALPWLYGIATNVCRNLSRKQRRHLYAVGRLPRERDVPDHADGVATRVDDERRMSELLAAIRELPQRDQDVLVLVAWSGLSYEQAAAALDVPIGTVRSRLARARKRLAAITEKRDQS